MRSAALVFGVLATGLGIWALAYGNLQTGLAATTTIGGDATVAKDVLYAIVVLGLLGALLALPWPRVGGVLLLLVAVAWAAAAFLAGHGAVLFAAAPFTFAAAAGLVGLSRRRPESRALVPAGADWDDDDVEEDDDEFDEPSVYAPVRRGLRDRERPVAPPRPARRQPPPRPAPEAEPEDEFEPDEAYIDAEEAVESEPEDGEYEEYADYEEEPGVLPPDDDGEPEDEEPEADDEPPPRGRWQLPDPDDSPAPRRTRQRYIPTPASAAPVRREMAPQRRQRPRPEPTVDLDEDDFAPPSRREFEPQPRNVYREFDPYDGRQERRRRGGGFLRLLAMLVILLIAAGIGVWVYTDYERGRDSILFGSRGGQESAASTTAVSGRPAATAKITNTPPARQSSPEGMVGTGSPTAPIAAVAPPAAALQPQAVPAAASSGYTDPFAYCRAVGTADTPDNQYGGPPLPDAVRAAESDAAADQIRWRCANQQVLACNANHTAACALTPTVDTMISYCATHPNANNIPAPNGSWSCNGNRPVIPRDQKWPVDARGFFPDAWKQVPGPGAAG